ADAVHDIAVGHGPRGGRLDERRLARGRSGMLKHEARQRDVGGVDVGKRASRHHSGRKGPEREGGRQGRTKKSGRTARPTDRIRPPSRQRDGRGFGEAFPPRRLRTMWPAPRTVKRTLALGAIAVAAAGCGSHGGPPPPYQHFVSRPDLKPSPVVSSLT